MSEGRKLVPCEVHVRLDNDLTLRECLYCSRCKAWLCDDCRGNWGRRFKAMLTGPPSAGAQVGSQPTGKLTELQQPTGPTTITGSLPSEMNQRGGFEDVPINYAERNLGVKTCCVCSSLIPSFKGFAVFNPSDGGGGELSYVCDQYCANLAYRNRRLHPFFGSKFKPEGLQSRAVDEALSRFIDSPIEG